MSVKSPAFTFTFISVNDCRRINNRKDRMIESGSALPRPILEDWQSLADCTTPLTWHTYKRIGGSNPSSSAITVISDLCNF